MGYAGINEVSVKRDLLYGKTDLLYSKRPANADIHEVCLGVKRDLLYGKTDLLYSKA